MRRLLLALALVLGFSGVARADGRAAEERHAYAEAIEAYDHEPGGAARAAWLRARSEGNFEPLATLETARRAPDPDVGTLVMEADSWPAGIVRVEAWVFAGDANMRKGHPEDAIPLWRKAARDPAADPALAHAAITSAVRAHLANGEVDQAKVDLQWLYDAGAAADVARVARRDNLHLACIGVLLVVGALIARARVRVRPARGWTGAVTRSALPVFAFSAFVSLAGLALAWAYAGATATPFLWFGVVLVPLLLAARAWAAAGGVPRAVRAGACAAAVVAAAFLVLEQTGQLDGLGL